ncbi:hypothetical protein [Nocardioides silvaticus]|uniref:hypothetical protein n=1 Tax=Nocardioides silvaticus TaxID=2201891 RepID=UPI0011B24D4F|nr:hypothetical protein [Nocardioides silvaticus]
MAVPDAWPRVDPDEVGWLGCHNVVLAPESSRAPGAGVERVVALPLSPERLTHQAAALCSAVGLWTADRSTPFHGQAPAGGGDAVALRTFTRHLSDAAVSSRVVARAIDVEQRYPVPAANGRPVQVLDDEVGAAVDMADRLVAAHPEVRARARETLEARIRTRLSLVELLALFFRFLGKALRRAPQDFVDSVLIRASSNIAQAAQDAFLGPDSTHVVTVRGIRGIKEDGTLFTPEEHDAELEALLARARDLGAAAPPEQHDYSELWRDFVNGALNLLDAGKRGRGLEPSKVGSEDGAVIDPRRVVVPPSDVFEIPLDLRSLAKVAKVAPYDVDAVDRTRVLLKEGAREQRDRAAACSNAQAELESRAEEHRRSYAGRVGERIFGELASARDDVLTLVQAVQGMKEGRRPPPELASLQRSLALTLLAHLAVFVGAVLVTLLLAQQDLVTWRLALLGSVGLAVVWLVSGLYLFHRRQQELFQLRFRWEDEVRQAALHKANLAAALEDVRRIQRVYRQYIDWVRALGTFLRAPWGHVAVNDGTDPLLGEGYPHNQRFGVAKPDDDAIQQVLNRLRPDLFPVGWLSRAWQIFRDDVPDIGEDGRLLEEDPELIFTDRAVASTSILTRWSRAIAARSWSGGASEVEKRIDELVARDERHRDRLLSRVLSVAGDGVERVESYQEFVEGLTEVEAGAASQAGEHRGSFSPTAFVAVPETTEPWTVAQALTNHSGPGTAESLVVTEISRRFPTRDLVFCVPPGSQATSPSDAAPPDRPAPRV